MTRAQTDVAVIGGGPAGLAAALEADRLGLGAVILEREAELGGILQQCIHDGFGIHRFKRRLSGTEYAQAFIDQLEGSSAKAHLGAMVLEIQCPADDERVVYAVSKTDGMIELHCKTVILAMGCRERTASQVFIYGERPAGIMTAGQVQRMINVEGFLPGKSAVILGSGDIGLIMARRMTLEGIEVKGVYEAMPSPGGLARNVSQCLNDFDIPLHLSSTVVSVQGRRRVESVTVAKLDESRKPIPETEEVIPCDLLVLSVGLLPENELSRHAGVEIDPKTKGPLLDESFMTSVPGIFACGNVAIVFDLVDYVSVSGELAAQGAFDYISKGFPKSFEYDQVNASGNISLIVPQRLKKGRDSGKRSFFIRAKAPEKLSKLEFSQNGETILSRKLKAVSPPEMIFREVEEQGLGPVEAVLEGGAANA
ncbi:MAG: NAD(P)/FAD-dependent oxidoreductase [Clostridiales bacterium]|jgi:NADPH-dependent 2,4-dienoyl-CoA reductase/sulfur reductase-like enzyme|nr:NAD(P)/FAD-dependent oxidoreductase [Clostridiales bacterium]MDR2752248.1 NAD(P)/FAD-dependent oxidoreductase [Clostridiales bacterium]